MTKQEKYKLLVKKRQAYKFQIGLHNPAASGFDWNEIEPWAKWHNNLDAKIMLIGQEFSDFNTFKRCRGLIEVEVDKYEFPSNKNIELLFNRIGIKTGHPLMPNKKASLFFTNCVMGLKDGEMSSNFKDAWIKESRELFLKPLIDIIQPKIIICLGSKATKSIGKIFKFKFNGMGKHLKKSPITKKNTLIFPVFHTGGLGLANRSKEKQIEDWLAIKKWL